MVFVMARPTKIAGSRYPYARKVVPKDVRGILKRTEFKRPLRGATAAENRILNAEALAEWEAEIAAARARLAGQTLSLTQKQIAAVSGEWYAEWLKLYEDEPGDEAQWEEWEEYLRSDYAQDERGLHPTNAQMEEAEVYLRSKGLIADHATIERTALSLHLTKLDLIKTLKRRSNRDWGPDNCAPLYPKLAEAFPAKSLPQSDALTFAWLVKLWADENQPPDKTRDKWDATFRGFAKAIGHDDAKRVTVGDVRRWKQARLADGKSLKTVSDGIGVCRSVFNWGITNGLLQAPNPFANMAPKVPKRGLAARDGYTDEEAARILKAAREETGWLRWLPWVLAFTGARIEEVAEARCRDVRQEAGTWIIDIVPTAQRRLKTAQSQRMVPLHPALIAEGSHVALS